MNKKVFIKTFGCQMNKADSDRLEGIFRQKGYEITKVKEDAEIIVYNTCSVREHAENKAMSHVGRLKFNKEENPNIKICVVGCMAERMKDEIKRRLPHVDIVAGPTELYKLPEIIEEEGTGLFKNSPNDIKVYYKHFLEITNNENVISGYIPIMKGCDNFCTYCIVPYVRGREKYRSIADIVEECKELSDKGISEIMLLGQAVNSHPEFKEILRKVSDIEKLKRIRFVTSYPGYMDKDIINIVAGRENLCNYFHIPVQSGSDKVLKKMNRKYNIAQFREIALYIREKLPGGAVTTDFIVGFPGEDEKDFQKTLDLIKEIEFDHSFTFTYSSRPGTAASKWEDTVNEEEKSGRLSILNKLCAESALNRNKLLEGERVEVIAEDKFSGRTDTCKIVHWKGKEAQKGEEVNVKIRKGLPHSLKGKRNE